MITKLYRILMPKAIREKIDYAVLVRQEALKVIHSKIDNIPEKKSQIRYLMSHFFMPQFRLVHVVFAAPFVEKYVKMNLEVNYDESVKLYYTMFREKRLYWKQGMQTKTIKGVHKRLLAEQDSQSAHRYFDDDYVFKDKILFDIGSAEGIVVLDHIEELKHAYLFECDEGWVTALSHTFKNYSDKVTIVSKYVSDISSENEVSIDDFVESNNIIPDIIKMDIEGYEEKALGGAAKTLISHHPFVSCCLYHTPDWEEKIVDKLSSMGYHCEISPYYMTFCAGGAPYLRHGNVKASK